MSVGEGTNITPIDIPKIPSTTIKYQTPPDTSTSGYKSNDFSFTLDSSVVQMIPYDWNTLSQIVLSNGNYPGTVFNGWNVTYDLDGVTYGIHVESDGIKYVYSAEVSSGTTKTPARIMPGDGIIFGEAAGYNADSGVLTLPKNANDITFTAKWDEPKIISYNGDGEINFEKYNPILGSGSVFTNILFYIGSYASAPSIEFPYTILGNSSFNEIYGGSLYHDVYFENVKLSSSINATNRLIIGENVTTFQYGSDNWYNTVNNYTPSEYDYCNISVKGSITHLVILGGTYGIVSSANNGDSYASIGSMTGDKGPKIALLYGGNANGGEATANSHIVVNNGTIIELLGGSRYTNSTSSNIEVRGGYVSYLTGGPRQGTAIVSNGNNVAVKINISGGVVDYLFSGAKDGNYQNPSSAPVYGSVEIKVSGGNVYGLFGGGYDFWAKTVYNGVIGDIDILITGGSVGDDNSVSWNTIGNSIGNKPSDYYSIGPGVYGGGYRGSVLGNVSVKIGSSDINASPKIYGNVYGGGSGGPDLSLMNNFSGRGEGHDDTTGQSYIGSASVPKNVTVVIGNATVSGDVYGGGKGVAKSSYVKNMYASYGGQVIGIFTDYNNDMTNVATVFGNTTVQIQNNASISGSVFGGGKGVSKSIWIGYDADQNPSTSVISSRLHNLIGDEYLLDAIGISKAKYQWQYCNGSDTTFHDISGATSSSLNISKSQHPYIRLKMTLVDTQEVIYSNAVQVSSSSNFYSSLSLKDWESWNVDVINVAAVTGTSIVNIENGTISGSVYGGGSYGAVGTIEPVVETTPGIHQHELVGGDTRVNIQDGTISGSVYGGGMGEPNSVTIGSVGSSSTINMGNSTSSPIVIGNIYGGGKNGFVGGAFIVVYFDKSIKTPSMKPIETDTGATTNTYHFEIVIKYVNLSSTAEKPGESTINIFDVNSKKSIVDTNVYGGGYGVNATITGKTILNISGGHINNVYGGGELGMIGKLAGQGMGSTLNLEGGTTAVNILSSTERENVTDVTIDGSVYGGGKGYFTVSADEIILGSVGESSAVNIDSKTVSGVIIKGSVYGGGELGLIGNYTVNEGKTLLNFLGGKTTVKVGGGTIYDNVYGGGMGNPYNTLSGAVGNTSVIIGGVTSNPDINGKIADTTTQIGFIPKLSGDYKTTTPIINENVNVSNNPTLSDGAGSPGAFEFSNHAEFTPQDGRSFIAIAKPTYGSISVKQIINLKETAVNSINTISQGNFKYDIYDVSESKDLTLTYSDGKNRYIPTWYKYVGNNTVVETISTLQGSEKIINYHVPADDSTIYVNVDDTYNTQITVNKPEYGQITVTLGNENLALTPEYTNAQGGHVYAAPVGATLTFTYSSPADQGYYVTEWLNNGVSFGTDRNTATLTVPAVGTESLISVKTENGYTVTVEKPYNGEIRVYALPEPDTSDPGNTLIENISKSAQLTPDASGKYIVQFGTKLIFNYIPNDSTTDYVKRWMNSPLLNMAQAEDDSDIMIMNVVSDTTVSILEGPAIGNVYGGGAYGIVGNITLDISQLGTDGYHAITSADNNANTHVAIIGGKIGATTPGSVSTGNVFGGGYGPNAVVAGSTHVYIGHAPKSVFGGTMPSASCIAISDNVYGGGEMGCVGATNNGVLLPQMNTQSSINISSNVSIFSPSSTNKIIIGHRIPESAFGGSTSELVGNVFGGGQGGDIPENVLKDVSTLESNSKRVRNGYATVYGTSNVVISGIPGGTTASGNTDSNIRIGSGVFGGGEGLIKGQSRHENSSPVTDSEAILESAAYGRVTGDLVSGESNATRVLINDAVVTQSVFGGGKLGILGNFDSSGIYKGKDSIVYISGFIRGNVFGGGEGHADSAVSGAVGNSLVIVGGNSQIGSNSGIHAYTGPDGLLISGGNVYGGGRLSIIGDFKVDLNSPGDIIKDNGNSHSDNASQTNVVILGGTVLNSVYGGGFSPKANVAGSAYVYIGDEYSGLSNNSDLVANHALCDQLTKFFNVTSSLNAPIRNVESAAIAIGNIYGGGEMGSVGTDTLVKPDSDGQLDDTDGRSSWVSANVSLHSSSTKVTIGIDKANVKAAGNIYGGGKGVLNSQLNGIPGYAVVRGNTIVSILGNANGSAATPAGITISIKGNVYGGGDGVQFDVESIRYAEVYDRTEVSISYANVSGNIYGGGRLGVVGHFVDVLPNDGDAITITQYDSNGDLILITGFANVNTDTKTVNIVDAAGNKLIENDLVIKNREFCGDDMQKNTDDTYKKGPKAYTGSGTAKVTIFNSKIAGNVFGGGSGAPTNILAGSVGRGTEVSIEVEATGIGGKVTPYDNTKTVIGSADARKNVYGGGDMGIVGSITTQIVGTGALSPVKVINSNHVSNVEDLSSSTLNFNTLNDVKLAVNIHGGTIHGSVYGSGKGEEIRLEGVNYHGLTVAYYKLSSFGRTEVNISNGVIKSNVYGGSENGETGSFSVLQRAQDFTNNYWQDINKPYAPPSDVPTDVRDNGYSDPTDSSNTIKADLPNFSATFVNLIGGTISGNVFGGGYYGAIYGTSHVHMGWSAMMPDGNTKGDCHYYNNYKDGSYGGKVDADNEAIGNIFPFDQNKEKLVSNLFIDGSVYAGGDRGNPDGKVSYDFITIYGTSHILLNGTSYLPGTNVIPDNIEGMKPLAAMYVKGSLFGSGNSCTTFYDQIDNSRFIIIKNYQAVTEGTDFSLFSIQRASNVTLTNSKLRLVGRSDGANADPTALYSLNHVYSLTLQSSNEGSSQIILDAPAQDLRKFVSQVYDGTQVTDGSSYIPTTESDAFNTVQLNGGIVLEVKKDVYDDKGSLIPNKGFGPVEGYFYLDVDLLSYYNAYVYGQRQTGGVPTGGFVYGSSFYGISFGTIGFMDSETTNGDLNIGYRAWIPAGGGGHLTASTTIVATNKTPGKDPSNSDSAGNTAYINTGKITLPMTSAGSRYVLVAYNIYPSQATGLGDKNRSLILISGEPDRLIKSDIPNDFDPIKKNEQFKLKISVGDGFTGGGEPGSPYFWFVDGGTAETAENVTTLNTSGGALPQFNLELYSQGVTKTAVAGRVVLTIQEETPAEDKDGNILKDEAGEIIYKTGNEVNINITIETQADAFGDKTSEGDYTTDTTLYVNSKGKYSYQYLIPPINYSTSYSLTLKNLKLNFENTTGANDFTLVDDKSKIGDDVKKYAISIKTIDVKNREGWKYEGVSSETFLTEANFANGNTIPIGTTDGRYQAGILITLYSKVPVENETINEQGYPKGTITFNVEYAPETTPETSGTSGTILINNQINTQLEIYTVSFVPGAGVTSIPPKQVNSGETLNGRYPEFVKELNDPQSVIYPKQDGKTFSMWKELLGYTKDADGNYIPQLSESSFDLSSTEIYHDVTLYAVYKHSVIFHYGYDNADGKENIKTLDVIDTRVDNVELGKLNPTRDGYTFGGWYNSPECKDGDGFKNENITQSIDVYAKWTPLSYNIVFDTNPLTGATTNPSLVEKIVCDLGNPIIQLPFVSSTGYTFGGWSLTQHITSQDNPDGVFTINLNNYINHADTNRNITLYAVWTEKPTVGVRISESDTTAIFSYYAYKGAEETPTWIPTTSLGTSSSFMIESGMSVLIKCDLNNDGKYYIYDAQYGAPGSSNMTHIYDINHTDGEPTISTSKIFRIESISDSTSVVINLTGKTYSVTLDPNGGSILEADVPSNTQKTIDVTYGKEFSNLAGISAERQGYKFNGWYLEGDNLSEIKHSTVNTFIHADGQKLIASYTPITHDVTASAGTGTSILFSANTVNSGTTQTVNGAVMHDNGYSFTVFVKKEYTQQALNEILSISLTNTLENGDIMETPLILNDNYAIRAGIVDPSTGEVSYLVNIKENVIRNNVKITASDADINRYTISGVVTDDNGVDGSGNPFSGTPLQGITINFDCIDGNALDENGNLIKRGIATTNEYGEYSITVTYGTTIQSHIYKWGYENRSRQLDSVSSDLDKDIIVIKNLKVIYNLNNGAGEAPADNGTYGSLANNIIGLKYQYDNGNKFTRTGYVFAGWALSPDADAAAYIPDQDYTITVDNSGKDANFNNDNTITFYAVWTPNTYTITFNGNGGKYNSADKYTQEWSYGTPLKLDLNKFIKDESDFKGWAVSASNNPEDVKYVDGATFTVDETNVGTLFPPASATGDYSGNMNLFAVWTDKLYNIYITDRLNTNEKVTTGDYVAYAVKKNVFEANIDSLRTGDEGCKLLIQEGEGYRDKLPAGTYYIFFNLKSSAADNIPLYALARLVETITVGFDGTMGPSQDGTEYVEDVTTPADSYYHQVAQIWSVKFEWSSVEGLNKGSYASMNDSGNQLLVVNQALPYQYNPLPLTDGVCILPSSNNFYFGGWYTDTNGTTEWNTENNVTSAVTVYAKWISKTLTITFKDGGSSVYNGNNQANTAGAITNIKVEQTVLIGGEIKTVELSLDGITPKTSWDSVVKDVNAYSFALSLDQYKKVLTSNDKKIIDNLGIEHTVNYTTIVDGTKTEKYSGSAEYSITPLAITITPVENQHKRYGDNLDHIYTGRDPSSESFRNYVNYTIKFTTADGQEVTLNYGELGTLTGYTGYSAIVGNLEILRIYEDASQNREIAQFDPVTGTYSYSLGTITPETNKNYTISLSETIPPFTVDRLPIVIKPEDGQWKFYGDEDNEIYTGKYGPTNDPYSSIKYGVSATINGVSGATPSFEANAYTPLIGVTVSYAGAGKFQNAGQYDTVLLDPSSIYTNNSNYDISIFGKDDPNQKIKFTIEKLPVVIVPFSGQYKHYVPVDFNGDLAIYILNADGTSSTLGKSLGFNTYDFRDADRSAPLTFASDTSGYAPIAGELDSDMLKTGAEVKADYPIKQGTVNNENNTNYVINYITYNNPTPVLKSASTLGANEGDIVGAVTKSSTSITISGKSDSYVYTGQTLNTESWTIVVHDTDNNIDIQTGTAGDLTIKYIYSSDNGNTWTNGLPTDVGIYNIKVYTDGNESYLGSETIVNVSITKVQITITPVSEYEWDTGTSYIEKIFDWTNAAPENVITNILNNPYYSIQSSEGGASISDHITIDSASYAQSYVNRSGSDIAAVKLTVSFRLDDSNNFNLVNPSIELNGMINPKDIAQCMIETISKQYYHGLPVTPSPVVKDGEHNLAAETDYSKPTYTSNNGAGTGSVSIDGVGNFKGTKNTTFEIKNQPYTVSGKIVSVSGSSIGGATVTISGNGITSSTATTGANGNYTFENIPYGTEVTIKVTADGYSGGESSISAGNYPTTSEDGKFKVSATGITLTPISYNITYETNGGENNSKNPNTYTVEDSVTLENPTKTGYTFKGWYTEATFGNSVTGITLGSTGDKIFYAKWEANKYKVTLDATTNGGTLSGSNEITVTYDEKYGSLPPAAKEGYEFTGWFTAETGGDKITAETVVKITADQTLYAQFSVNQYTITFDSNGGSAVESVAVADGGLLGKPADPTRSGYTFNGWYKDPGLTMKWDFTKDRVTADMTLYADWIPKHTPTPTPHQVEYNANGGEGEVPKSELHFAGEFVTVKSADLSRFGYDFKGWCDSVTQTTYQPGDEFKMPSRDVCLTAVWDKKPIQGKEVSVTFIVDNEVYGISSTHIDTSLNGAMQPDPVKEGFDFLGWYTKDGQVFTSETIVKDDMTVYAKFELSEDYVLVTYIIDKEIYMTLACKKSMITEPHVSGGIGKELNGWYTDEELQNKFDFNTVIEEDHLTLYAEWKGSSEFMIWLIFALFAFFIAAIIASAKRVSFYENEDDEEKYASVIMIGKGTLGDKFPQSPNNQNFEGWYSEEGELVTEETEIKQSMKLHARWKD